MASIKCRRETIKLLNVSIYNNINSIEFFIYLRAYKNSNIE
jgi:hypothetical protein